MTLDIDTVCNKVLGSVWNKGMQNREMAGNAGTEGSEKWKTIGL